MTKRRSYSPVKRQQTTNEGRERILAAAEALLEDAEGEGFSIDAVARRAGVARMTVYNQFASKAGLLEALFDAMALRGALGQMADVFKEADPVVALDQYVALFGRFWTGNRGVHRGLRAAALHDVELASAMASRNERRRRGVAELARRLRERYRPAVMPEEVERVMFVLLSFETFDTLAGESRTPMDVVPVVQQLARVILGISAT